MTTHQGNGHADPVMSPQKVHRLGRALGLTPVALISALALSNRDAETLQLILHEDDPRPINAFNPASAYPDEALRPIEFASVVAFCMLEDINERLSTRFSNKEEKAQWLTQPNPDLEHEQPVSLLNSADGVRRVRVLLLPTFS